MTGTSIERAIGRLEGKFDSLDGKLDSLIEAHLRSDTTALSSRQEVQVQLEDLQSHIRSVEIRVSDTEQSLRTIEPFAKKAERWEQRGIGALAFAGMVGSGLTAAVGLFWTQLRGLFG